MFAARKCVPALVLALATLIPPLARTGTDERNAHRMTVAHSMAGICDEVAEDLPECTCYLDPAGPGPGEWPPLLVGAARRNVVNVADRTLGAITSCWEAGGQPYWQMQLQFFGPISARDGAVADPDMIDDNPREAWCTETIAYWHAAASIPYWNGYQSDWYASKIVRNTRDLREWYKVAEELGERGRWIAAEELDYENFIPGVNGPCPGAYQQREGCEDHLLCLNLFDYPCCWLGPGDSHSQLVESLLVYQSPDGTVRQIDMFIIDGNTGRGWGGFGGAGEQNDVNGDVFSSAWVSTNWYPDIIQYTRLGDALLGNDKIRGWGINLDEDGNPICDGSRIRTVVGPFFRGTLAPGPEEEEDSAAIGKFMVYMGQTGGQKAVTSNSSMVQTGSKLPTDSGDVWVIPAGTHPTPGPVEIDVDLLADYPYPVRGVVIEWQNGVMPPTWDVWWSAQNVQIHTKTITRDPTFIPDANTPTLPYHVRFKPPTPTLPDTGYTVRYIRLRIPNPVPAMYRITGVHYLYYNGPEEDGDSVSLEPEPTCFCGSMDDPHFDVNRDGIITSSDIIANVNIVFKGALGHPMTPLCPVNRSDGNCDGVVTSSDLILAVNYVFKGGAPPCDPCS